MDTIVNVGFFVGGVFFAIAYPSPALYIRGKVADGLKSIKARVFPADPPK